MTPTTFDFPKQLQSGQIMILETEVMVSCGWTVHIPREKAVAYVRKGTNEPVEGFHHHAGYVILTHAGAKIALPEKQGLQLIEGIRQAYAH